MTALDDEAERTRLEAAAFRRLTAHLQARTDVQNIDLMNLAGFCRNCLSNWLEDAARDAGLELTKAEAREHVYGMPAEEWKRRYQTEASPSQQQAFAHANADHRTTRNEAPTRFSNPDGPASER